jgi:DHA2 family multidrug resistance protein
MAQTSSYQSNSNLTLQLICLGLFFGFILLELLMCYATMPPELMTSASAINFFGTAIAKVIAGGVSGAIHSVSTQGSWDRFRGLIAATNTAILPYQELIQQQMLEGINAPTWSQGSLELINQAIAQQADVVAYINIATMTGILLLGFGVLPFLHREN